MGSLHCNESMLWRRGLGRPLSTQRSCESNGTTGARSLQRTGMSLSCVLKAAADDVKASLWICAEHWASCALRSVGVVLRPETASFNCVQAEPRNGAFFLVISMVRPVRKPWRESGRIRLCGLTCAAGRLETSGKSSLPEPKMVAAREDATPHSRPTSLRRRGWILPLGRHRPAPARSPGRSSRSPRRSRGSRRRRIPSQSAARDDQGTVPRSAAGPPS